MTEKTIIGVSTYGTHTKTYQEKRVSTLKIGYSGIIPQVLLALLPDAMDVSSKRDSYIYIYIPEKPKLCKDWLFIELTAEKLATLESLTTASKRSSGIAVWQEGKWMLPPNQTQPQYHEPTSSYDAPKGSPVGFWAIRTDGSVGSTGNPNQLIAEYSKLYPNRPAWWWIAGNQATYDHQAELKRWGCRWKRNRRAYAYRGDTLPEGLLSLLDNGDECRAIMQGMNPDEAKKKYRQPSDTDITTDDDSEPCSLEEAEAILGITSPAPSDIVSAYDPGRVAWTTQNLPKGIAGRTEHIPVGTKYTILSVEASDDPLNPAYVIQYGDQQTARVLEEEIIPRRIFHLGDTVYARQETKTNQGDLITTGTSGKISKLYRLNRNLGSRHSYDVEWEGMGVEWMFEDELSAIAPDPNIRITRGTVVPGGQGSTAADERQAILAGGHQPQALEVVVEKCICEDMDGPAGWLPAKHLGTWVACGSCNPQGKNLPESDPTNPEADKPPAIRIIKPTALDDDEIAQAVRQTSVPQINRTPSVSYHAKVTPLPMACVGELTGSVIANVFCYGYALDGDELIFLNMGGPRSGIEAIRAKLSKGDIVNLMRWDDPSIELSAGEGNTGVYTAYINNMAEARFVHCLLAHERLVHPNYNGSAKTYIIQMSEEQAKAQLLHHVRETVKLPVFPDWIEYLWQAGQVAKLVRNTRAGGGLVIKAIDLDVDAWGRLIQYGVAEKAITIPQL